MNKENFWKKIARMERNGASVNIDIEKVKEAYQSIFTESNRSDDIEDEDRQKVNEYVTSNSNVTHNHVTTPEEIRKMLNNLSLGKAVGIRGLSHEMLKYNGSETLTNVIAKLFDAMINFHVSPEIFNVAIIKPIIKDENKANDDINNIRPVAISDALANLYENLLLDRVKKVHMDSNKQFGFKSNSSCNHAAFMLYIASKVIKSRGQHLYACAIDASKAFDKVCRSKLWLKLIEKKFPPEIIIAIVKYYDQSWLMVELNNKFSNAFRSTQGVRQGGVLSPKLFSIYIEDLVDTVESVGGGVKIINSCINILMYADDIIVMSTTRAELQKQLDKVGEYGHEHGIKFNPSKCELLIINCKYKRSNHETQRDGWQGVTTLSGIEIPTVDKFRYLGLIFNNQVNNADHLTKRRQATFAMLNRIKNLGLDSGVMQPQLIGNMFKTYVRPVIMYGLEILDLNIGEIEQIRRLESLALKRMLKLKKRCYTRHLMNSLKISSTTRYLESIKLKFFLRASKNAYTNVIVNEWIQTNQKSKFITALAESTRHTPRYHLDGTEIKFEERCRMKVEAIDKLNNKNQKDDPIALKLKRVFKMSNSDQMRMVIEDLIHAKNAPKELI